MESEIWLPIPDWEGLYEVSNCGQVRSLDRTVHYPDGRRSYTKPGKILGWRSSAGYQRVVLSAPGRGKHEAFIHELVLTAFVGPPPDGFRCCHADDNKQNNHLNNLRWDTYSANMHDRVRNGIHHQAKRTECPKCGRPYDHFSNGRRACLACRRAYKRDWWRRKAGYYDRIDAGRSAAAALRAEIALDGVR